MKQILDFVYNTITTDSDMQDLFPNSEVVLHYGYGRVDSDRPVISYKEDIENEMVWPIICGRFTFDITNYGDTADLSLSIRDRMVALLERNFYNHVDGHVGFRMWKESEMNFPLRDQYVWRRIMIFGFRAVAEKDITAVISR